jgi:hypothetical protein
VVVEIDFEDFGVFWGPRLACFHDSLVTYVINFYRKFIKDYLKITLLLLDIIKKTLKFI